MLFSYKAMRENGETYEGRAEAEDRYALARRLKQDGETLVSVDEINSAGGKKRLQAFSDSFEKYFGRIKTREKILFARNLAAMIGAGLSISRALGVMERQTNNKKFKDVLNQLAESVSTGKALSVALKEFPKIFSSLFVSMVKAGEESGKLSEALYAIADQLDRIHQIKRKVRGAMMYPSIVIIAMIVVGIVMLTFVVPTLTSTFEELGVDLPASTRAVIAVSDFLSNNIILSLVIITVVVVGIVYAVRKPGGKRFFGKVILRVPLIGSLVKQVNAARTARTLSSLLTSGVEVVSALAITGDVIQNQQYRKVIREAEDRIQKGSPIHETFQEHEDLYPTLFSEMMSVGEEVGDLPKMLEEVAEFYEGEVEQRTKDLSTIIEPFLMIIIGVVVGFFAVSMISPIYDISSGI